MRLNVLRYRTKKKKKKKINTVSYVQGNVQLAVYHCPAQQVILQGKTQGGQLLVLLSGIVCNDFYLYLTY